MRNGRFLGAIEEAQAVGFTPAQIAEYLCAARRSSGPSEALRVRMAAKIDQIDGRIAALRRMPDELARFVGCACVSLDHGPVVLPPSPAAAGRRRRGHRSATSRSAKAQATRCVRPHRWRRAVVEGRAPRGPVPALPRQKLLRARALFLAHCGWGGRQAPLHRSSGATGSCSRRSATTSRSCSGSSTTSITSSSSSTALARPRRAGRARAPRDRLLFR